MTFSKISTLIIDGLVKQAAPPAPKVDLPKSPFSDLPPGTLRAAGTPGQHRRIKFEGSGMHADMTRKPAEGVLGRLLGSTEGVMTGGTSPFSPGAPKNSQDFDRSMKSIEQAGEGKIRAQAKPPMMRGTAGEHGHGKMASVRPFLSGFVEEYEKLAARIPPRVVGKIPGKVKLLAALGVGGGAYAMGKHRGVAKGEEGAAGGMQAAYEMGAKDMQRAILSQFGG